MKEKEIFQNSFIWAYLTETSKEEVPDHVLGKAMSQHLLTMKWSHQKLNDVDTIMK